MKKFFSIVFVVALLVGVLFVGYQQRVDATEVTIDETTINVTTRMMNNCWDESYKGNVRIEQMFVEEVEYTDDELYNVITMYDTTDNEWIVTGLDLFLYEDVLVLMCDNETPNDISDDVIIHCWVGIE